MEYSNFDFKVLSTSNLENMCLIEIFDKTGLNDPKDQWSKTYFVQPMEYSNFDFKVLSIANLGSTCLIGILDR